MEQDHMFPEHPPSYTQSHDPQSLEFPAVPSSDLPIRHERTLPPLPSAPTEQRLRQEPVTEPPFIWPSSNPLTAYYQPGPSQLSSKNRATPTVDSPSLMDSDVQDRGRRDASVLSIDKDDMDVRIAAEALGELRADFIHSPPHNQSSLPTSSPQTFPSNGAQQPEPLLSLLTTSHPLIGTAIGGSLSAYSASKNYSPRFKTGAEYIERRFTPVVNTVGSVGRLTGVEGGVRWFLGDRRPSHHHLSDGEADSEGFHKRRKIGTEDREDLHDLYNHLPTHQRRSSHASTTDSLPAYDSQTSPLYTATSVPHDTKTALIPTQADEPASPSWQSRLVLSTSGLSIAMSEESLRSLKYCLSWLRWANEHIGKVILALKAVLEEYNPSSSSITYQSTHNQQLVVRSEAERSALNARVAALKADVLKTLKEVVDIVSKYAGGALPENARVLVRKHLTSLPQRFRLANAHALRSDGERGDREVADGANRVIVLAKEGLDMMAQVSGVLDGTIVSAEEWCERLGRRRGEEEAGVGTGGMGVGVMSPPVGEEKDIDGQRSPRVPVAFGDVKLE